MGLFKMVAGKLVEVSAEELAKKTAKGAAKKAASKKAASKKAAPKKKAAKKGRPTKQQKAAATRAKKKAAAATPAKKKMAQKPGTAKRKATRMTLKGRSPEQAKELRKLVQQVRKEMTMEGKPQAKPIQSRIPTKTPPKPKQMTKAELMAEARRRGEKDDYTGRLQQPQVAKGAYEEGPNTALPSKIEIDSKLKGYSRAQLKRLVSTGQARVVKNRKTGQAEVKATGRFAPPASMIAKKMGTGKATEAMINKVTEEVDLTKVRDPRPIRAKKVKFGTRLRNAMRSGEPTTLEDLQKGLKVAGQTRKATRGEVTAQVEKSAAKAAKDAISKINNKAAVARSKLGKAVQDGKITKAAADRANRKVEDRRKKNIDRAVNNIEQGKPAEVDRILRDFPFVGKDTTPSKIGVDTVGGRTNKKKGGQVVPPKYKGFSKLPEKVQQNMDPQLAAKYEKGGKIKRGMKKAGKGLKKLGAVYGATPAGMLEMLDLLEMGINLGLKKGGSVKGGGAALRGHGKAMRKKGK